jgi:glycosyltransferase involved in cell wall biosynthesis
MKGGITRFWLGNKIFEYLSASLALVNNVPGEATEIIAAGDLGNSVAPRDATQLATQLRRMVNDAAGVRRQMENARREFESRFDREGIQTHYLAHLEALINT